MKISTKSINIILITTLMLGLLVIPAVAATTITTVDNNGDVGYFTSLALNSSGFPVISYYDHGNHNLKLAICGDVTCTSKTITTVDSMGDVGSYTSLELNSSGFPIISYFDATNSNLKVAFCGDANCTSKTITTVDSARIVEQSDTLALNSSGFPVISYMDANGNLKVAICGDIICTSKSFAVVDNSPFAGYHTSLKLNPSNFPVISYMDGTNSDLKIAICGDANCASKTITTVDSVGAVGAFTSLALTGNNFPVIGYHDSTNQSLKVAVCGDTTCISKTVTTVNDSSYAGYDTSLVLNNNGFPIISYQATHNLSSYIKVAVCENITCTTKNISTVDTLGMYTSLKLNASGFPVISYLGRGVNDTTGELRLATITLPLTPLTVLSHTLNTNYTNKGPVSFTVTFSENVNNPTGNTATDDVTNPANFKIINKGENNFLDTKSCADAIKGDDLQIIPQSITYIPNSATINLSSDLPVGNYRFFVCGTTSITDLSGTPLNGGTDFTFDFTIAPAASSASSLPKTGFAPNRITSLPVQPANLTYNNLGDIWLEIPSLNIKTDIVGVPQSSNGWNVDWLGQSAGWLNGTAFPSWEGNSVITAHVTDSNGKNGPFANIKNLKHGDKIIVHMYGEKYIFEVRDSNMVIPSSTKSALEHLEGHSYLTLITCQTYNPLSDSYLFRRVVRAVLVETQIE